MIRKAVFLLAVSLAVLLGRSTPASAQIATGGGVDFFGDRFSFVAVELNDGTVIGEAQFMLPDLGIRLHVEIDCLLIVDNIAVMTGVVVNAADPTDVGQTALFAVIDNGQGANDPRDGVVGPFPIPSFLDCIDFGPPPLVFLSPIAAGNIQVRP